MTAVAETEREAVVERVAAAIWPGYCASARCSWSRAVIQAEKDDALSKVLVRQTRRRARRAIQALMIGDGQAAGAARMAHAGDHVCGLGPQIAAETFDAMLGEVLL
jgi:hypothetical protein